MGTMRQSVPAALGRKRPLLNVEIERLHLDADNPRLPEEAQGTNEDAVLKHLFEHFDLEEIASPMGQNGYFDEEPLVAIPLNAPAKLLPEPGAEPSVDYWEFLKTAHFTVMEGNRRLATARILLDTGLQTKINARGWTEITDQVRSDLKILPVIVYPTRAEVLPYLGVRHITGNKKWESYAKARYISSMLDEGHSVEMIEKEVGDRSHAVLKSAVAYKILQQAKTELDWDITRAKEDFSYMLLAIGQRNIKLFLGWIKQDSKTLSLKDVDLTAPIPESHLLRLKDFLSWVYGEGSKVLPVIKESRDITNTLSHVLASEKATEYLRIKRDLTEAYDLTDGEEAMVRKLLGTANTKLEKVLGIAHRHKTTDVIAEATKCTETASQILKTLKE